ncbi:sensor histidine kinase [Streptomyces olivaceus]|uniref:sensor histidine kinase n=1 Tax=Streptomyces olivaceus TaxID=47716 RepID=UPI002DDA975F|nr:ATP-binding protein [Streptomyces olivaceus]
MGAAGGRAVLELSDQGSGMTAGQATRAFDGFYRADTAHGLIMSGGAGLGLSIVHSLAALHEGHVETDTTPGQGATFRVILPLYVDLPRPMNTRTRRPAPHTSLRPGIPSPRRFTGLAEQLCSTARGSRCLIARSQAGLT